MKSQTQIFVLIVAIVVLVGGITFVRNWFSSKQDSTDDGVNAPAIETRLDFNEKVAPGTRECEINGQGHYDFWFQNPNDFAVEIGLDKKSCTCAHVDAFVLTPEEEQLLRKKMAFSAPTVVLDASASALHSLAGIAATLDQDGKNFLSQSERWQKLLDKDDTSLMKVPAKTTGIVRLSWRGEKPGGQRLGANVWGQLAGQTKTRNPVATLEVPVTIVPPIQVFPETEAAFTLEPAQSYEFTCLCWSSTRPKFRIKTAREETEDPCFHCSFALLTGEELKKWITTLNANLSKTTQPTPTEVLCMYQVRVKVEERLPGGPQMAMGPFMRKVVLTTDQEDFPSLTINVQGIVRGDFKIGTEDDQHRVILKTFSARRGTSVTVPIVTNLTGVVLQVKSKKPDYLLVHLQAKQRETGDVGQRWDLLVTVPPGRAAGPLARDSEIILSSQGQSYRMIRIPVRGTATSN
jgi:hypothetical protein